MELNGKSTIFSFYGGSNTDIDDFCKEHGDRSVQRGDWFYFADGAMRGIGRYGQLIEPPTCEIECQQAVVKFWEHAVKKAAEHFYDYRNNVARYNTENTEIMANLKFLQKQAKDCQRELRGSTDQLLCLELGVEDVKEARKLKAEEDQRAAENLERAEFEEQQAQAKAMSIRI